MPHEKIVQLSGVLKPRLLRSYVDHDPLLTALDISSAEIREIREARQEGNRV